MILFKIFCWFDIILKLNIDKQFWRFWYFPIQRQELYLYDYYYYKTAGLGHCQDGRKWTDMPLGDF